jgi:hypothetical protein
MAQPLGNDALDTFGSLLMKRVRDWSIQQCDALVDGKMKGEVAQRLSTDIVQLDDVHRTAVHRLIPYIVDTVLHYTLWMFEQEQSLQVAVRDANGVPVDLRAVELGDLDGYLIDWVAQFSQELPSDLSVS